MNRHDIKIIWQLGNQALWQSGNWAIGQFGT
jgi:hypothetical protein